MTFSRNFKQFMQDKNTYRHYTIPPGAGIQFLQSEVNLTIFARGRRPRAKHCQIDRGLKKLSGLREVFVLPYAVNCADFDMLSLFQNLTGHGLFPGVSCL